MCLFLILYFCDKCFCESLIWLRHEGVAVPLAAGMTLRSFRVNVARLLRTVSVASACSPHFADRDLIILGCRDEPYTVRTPHIYGALHRQDTTYAWSPTP